MNPELRRLGATYALCCIAEMGIWIVLLIYAYEHGGAAAGSTIVLVQLIPCIVLGPFLGAVADVYEPKRVLVVGVALQFVSMSALAAAVELDAPVWLVFALAPLTALSITLNRPTQAALFPTVVRTPDELTAANVMSGWTYGAACLVGPMMGGVLVAWHGVGSGIGGCALLAGVAVLPAVRLRPLQADDSSAPGHGAVGFTALHGLRSYESELRSNLRSAMDVTGIRLMLTLHGFYFLLIGAVDLLCVILAASYLHLGSGGAGYLNAAFGAGAVIAGFGTAFLIGRRRLKNMLVLTLAAAVLALGLISLVPRIAPVLVLLALVGFSGALFDVTGRTLLQRSSPTRVVAGVFAILETLMDVGLVLGALLVRVAYSAGGLRLALVAPAGIALVLLVALGRRLQQLDNTAVVPVVEIRLLRAIPIFAALPAPELEGVAYELDLVTVPAGTTVFRQGELGDRYYAVSSGSLSIVRHGELVQTVGRGQGFGEIALIRDVPRQATVTAESDALLYSLRKDVFVETVTGHARASNLTRKIIEGHMGDR
jgi:MFS family permease